MPSAPRVLPYVKNGRNAVPPGSLLDHQFDDVVDLLALVPLASGIHDAALLAFLRARSVQLGGVRAEDAPATGWAAAQNAGLVMVL